MNPKFLIQRADRLIKTTCGRQWLFVATALALSGVPAMADDANLGEPLIQARFDQLVPTSYPTIRPRFDRLIQTSWPVIHPGVAQVPITANLVRPLDQPLLIVNPVGRPYLQSGRRGQATSEPRQTSARPHAPPRSRANYDHYNLSGW